jgi:hypothetical protein
MFRKVMLAALSLLHHNIGGENEYRRARAQIVGQDSSPAADIHVGLLAFDTVPRAGPGGPAQAWRPAPPVYSARSASTGLTDAARRAGI